jgi:hypothetical protein
MSADVERVQTEAAATQSGTSCCARCGSANVLRDAWACWDVRSGDWVLASVFDHAFCVHCDAETTLTER